VRGDGKAYMWHLASEERTALENAYTVLHGRGLRRIPVPPTSHGRNCVMLAQSLTYFVFRNAATDVTTHETSETNAVVYRIRNFDLMTYTNQLFTPVLTLSGSSAFESLICVLLHLYSGTALRVPHTSMCRFTELQ
jgi:hypothetical protein